MKRIVSFSLETTIDDQLIRVSKAMGWPKSEIVEKALSQIFRNPTFNKAIANIKKIQKETDVLSENAEAKTK